MPEASKAIPVIRAHPQSAFGLGRRGRFLLLMVLFLTLSLVLGTESFLYARSKYPEALWQDYVLYPMPLWIPWIFLAPLATRVARRFRLDQRPGAKILGVHLAALVAILACHLVFMCALIALQISFVNDVPPRVAAAKYLGTLTLGTPAGWALRNLITYGVILAVGYTADYRRALKDRELQASRLEGQVAKAQLQALKSQLHPHFLFNSLNAISTLMRTDMGSAERMLDMLAELLRRSLRDSAVQEVPLEQEMDFVNRYLDIEQVRFSDRLKVEIDIASELRSSRVPHLILQPLVENAIRHGIGPKPGPGTVRIAARREAQCLVLSVSDDGMGPGPRRTLQAGEGVGLANTQARLEQLFGDQATVEADGIPGGGFRVILRLPFRGSEPNNQPDQPWAASSEEGRS